MQLDLFTQPLKPAIVYAFPLSRRGGLVRETAEALASRSYAKGQRFWSQHLREHRRALREAGLSEEMIREEIARYSRAVARDVVILDDYRQSM